MAKLLIRGIAFESEIHTTRGINEVIVGKGIEGKIILDFTSSGDMSKYLTPSGYLDRELLYKDMFFATKKFGLEIDLPK